MLKPKIFIPLGTQKFPFGRLINAFNSLVERGVFAEDEIVMQSTVYDVEPKFKHVGLISLDEFNHYLNESEIIVTHAGVNSIISCMNRKKAFIVVPRLSKYGEHVDDHQLEIAKLMESQFNVLVLWDMMLLEQLLEHAKQHIYKPWVSKKDVLIQCIRESIE